MVNNSCVGGLRKRNPSYSESSLDIGGLYPQGTVVADSFSCVHDISGITVSSPRELDDFLKRDLGQQENGVIILKNDKCPVKFFRRSESAPQTKTLLKHRFKLLLSDSIFSAVKFTLIVEHSIFCVQLRVVVYTVKWIQESIKRNTTLHPSLY